MEFSEEPDRTGTLVGQSGGALLAVVRTILDHLGLPTEASNLAPARITAELASDA